MKTPTSEYTTFCLNKVLLNDVSPLYLTFTNECYYSQLYKSSFSENEDSINLIKNLFFISDDGKFIEFIKNLYEDFLKYSTTDGRTNSVIRIQGIKTYFSNWLISNTNNSYNFSDIKNQFKKIVIDRLDVLFFNYKPDQYISAKKYLFDVFVTYHFDPIHNLIKQKYDEKYRSPLKNALSFGKGQYSPILNSSFIDERTNDFDPFTLIVKLQNSLPNDLSIKSLVWISNISIIPISFNSIIQKNDLVKTIKISPPDFTIISQDVSLSNSNTFYNYVDLQTNSGNQNDIEINKKINELNVDYTSFSNFIVFSSAGLRHTIFKNKMISLSEIDSELSTLETNYSSSGYTYPYYTLEQKSLRTQKDDIIESFDGFDSYLYKTGYYQYSTSTQEFYSGSFITYMDDESAKYDKFNRDSFVNNTPEHIVSDPENDDYLIFLSMVGHYFDNLYIYIKSLPSQRFSENSTIFSRTILQQMLQSFGWKLDTSLDFTDISNTYLDTKSSGNSIFSADERTRQIWNRILNTLPLIYKSKGTDECIRIVLACYGIPSTLINIKEYGGVDYTSGYKTSYTIEEKIFMLIFKGYREYISIPFDSTLKTIEFKVALDPNKTWNVLERIPLAVKYDQNEVLNWEIGVYKEKSKNVGRVYFELSSSIKILSESLPIFTGEIFNIMVRRNNPDNLFEYNSTPHLVPTKYDMWVQRKENSRNIFSSLSSSILTKNDNIQFSNTGTLYFGNYDNSGSFIGQLDKILLWDSPITDDTYNDHSNNINSYSFTGSAIPYETLYFRMNFDYPQDFSGSNPFIIVNQNETYSSSISASAFNFGIVSFSSSVDNCVSTPHSTYPFQFKEISYNQTFTINSYGPNKFKNQKIKKTDLTLVSRLDSDDRSTYSPNKFVSPDSNQIGLFADPNDYKNKDIFRYLGNCGITSLLADPVQMFDDKYTPLKNVRESYNKSGNKRVYYNEMQTLYKFYFDKSIFDTVKQLIPSRNVVFSGIIIEPTVLERPKYQYKRINSEASILEFTASMVSAPITGSADIRPPTMAMNNSIYSAGKITCELISSEFGIQKNLLYENYPFYLPDGPYQPNDPLYLNFLSLKPNLIYVDSGWIKKYSSFSGVGNIEQHPDWIIPANEFDLSGPPLGVPSDFVIGGVGVSDGAIPGFYFTGSGYFYLRKCYFYAKTNSQISNFLFNSQKNLIAPINLSQLQLETIGYQSTINNGIIVDISNFEELGIHCDDYGKIIETNLSGSYPRYLVKNWNKDTVFSTVGEYNKPQSVESQSLYLYTTQIWNAPFYESLVYTSSKNEFVPFDIALSQNQNIINYSPIQSISSVGFSYYHDANTWKQRPNTNTNNLFSINTALELFLKDPIKIDVNTYFETMVGYPRNHLTHKRIFFSKESKPESGVINIYSTISSSLNTDTQRMSYFNFKHMDFVYSRYVSSRQTINTTVDVDGLTDNSLPIQTVNVSNIDIIKPNNVLK